MLETYVPSGSLSGVYWRVSVAVVGGRVYVRCTCTAGRHNEHRALPCRHARQALEEAGMSRLPGRAFPAPDHDRNGRPEYPPNVSAMVD